MSKSISRLWSENASPALTVKLKREGEDVARSHQRRIALRTLKMSGLGAELMGGMNMKQAIAFLRKDGMADRQIADIMRKAGHPADDITKFMGEGRVRVRRKVESMADVLANGRL